MRKFDIQDRVVLDDMVDTWTKEMHKEYDEAKVNNRRPIITREYYMQMLKQIQEKIDAFTTKKALNTSKQYR